MQIHSSLDAFTTQAKAEGFDEVLERLWDANVVTGVHTHPFSVHAQVVRGEMWLEVDGHSQHLRAGDTFQLGAHIAHQERYGAEGAAFWVARRHA